MRLDAHEPGRKQQIRREKALPSDALAADRALEGEAFCPLLEHDHRVVKENAQRHSGEGIVARDFLVLDIPSMQSIDEALRVFDEGSGFAITAAVLAPIRGARILAYVYAVLVNQRIKQLERGDLIKASMAG